MFWYKDKREEVGNQEAEMRAAVLRRLREVIDYRPQARDMAMMLSQAVPSESKAACEGQH